MEHLNEDPAMVVNIGLLVQQIKPVFDVDAYDNNIDINDIKAKINELLPDKPVNYAK